MPRISVVFYQEDAQTVPVLDWLDGLPAKAQDKCCVRIERLRAVLAHGLVKEREVPPREIEEAIRRKQKFESDPARHTYKEG
jgi:hypothetical protein